MIIYASFHASSDIGRNATLWPSWSFRIEYGKPTSFTVKLVSVESEKCRSRQKKSDNCILKSTACTFHFNRTETLQAPMLAKTCALCMEFRE